MRRMVLVAFCEPCHHNGIEVQAVTSRRISVDHGPVKELDLCDSCNRNLMIPLLAAYEACEQEPPTPKQQERLAKKAQSVQAARKRELVAVPDPLPESEEPKSAEPAKAKKHKIRCPLDHPYLGGGPREVTYETRQSHAETHNLTIADIAWEDPEGHLKASCTTHKKCVQNNVRFITAEGVASHVRAATKLELVAE